MLGFKRSNTFLIIPFLFCIIFCNSCSQQNAPEVTDGILDLTKWDLDKEGPIYLTGNFEFYWQQFLTYDDFHKPNHPEMTGYIAMPGPWNDFKIKNKRIGPYGYATYRLRIKLKKTNIVPLALKINNELVAYHVYVNNKLLMKGGTPGKTEETTTPCYKTKLKIFKADNEILDIIIHASNFHQILGGNILSLQLGTENKMIIQSNVKLTRDIFIFGTLFFMAMYHLMIFLLRKESKSSLCFSLFTMSMAFYLITVSEKVINSIYPEIPWFCSYKTAYLLVICSMIFFLFFIFYLFKDEGSKKIVYILQSISVIFFLITLFSSSKIYTFIILYFYINVIMILLYILFVSFKAIRNKRDGSGIFMFSIIISFLFITNDMLNTQSIIQTGDFIPLGTMVFFFLQSYLIAFRFNKAMIAEERLSKELSGLNANLEFKVKERTRELEEANKEMAVINENLKTTTDALWGEMEIAKKIQTMLLVKDPSIPGFDIAVYMEPADEVGGDYYDIINIAENNWFIIADVSGHGVPAGLIMMMAQVLLNFAIKEFHNASPSEILVMVNRQLAENIKKISDDKYVTITALSSKENKFIFSGVHQDILIYRAEAKDVERIETEGFFLGIIDDVSDFLNNYEFTINRGDVVLLYTDGITESWPRQEPKDSRFQKMYGEKKLIDILQRHGQDSAENIKNKVLQSMQDFQTDDDVTFMVLKKI